MDTSETYIKMSERAEEIQALKREEKYNNTGKWKPGDFWTIVYNAGIISVVPHRYEVWADIPYLDNPEDCIWLPRQDQLQEMLRRDGDDFNSWFRGHITFTFSEMSALPSWCSDDGREIKFTSMEQLWLAYAMFKNYGKSWDGENWIKQ